MQWYWTWEVLPYHILSKHIAWESALWANTNYPTLQIILNPLNIAEKQQIFPGLGEELYSDKSQSKYVRLGLLNWQELVSLEMVAEAFFVLTE